VFSVISAIEGWPSWNPAIKWVKLQVLFSRERSSVEVRSELTHFDAAGSRSSREIGWTGTTMSIKAVHVFRFEPKDGGTLVSSEESWEGLIASMAKGYSRRSIDKAIMGVLAHLKTEAERRAGA
jgi:hypothetical protein